MGASLPSASDARPHPGRRAARPARRTLLVDHRLLVLGAVLVVLVGVNAAVEPGYLSAVGLRNTLIFATPLAIIAAGQTLCMLTGGIDLSVAITATGAAYVAGPVPPTWPATSRPAGRRPRSRPGSRWGSRWGSSSAGQRHRRRHVQGQPTDNHAGHVEHPAQSVRVVGADRPPGPPNVAR